ncbi:MAG TPA: MerR family transcriptional regulator, partial [Candidatus Agrococcus pullicola]|nr:MerR family transcriptional regulator [Candidatus Agrococcus pullicola]
MLIGEVSERSGVSARMLRHYDKIGLVRPSERTQGGYRKYSEADIRRLFHVEGLRSLGLELQEIAEVLDDRAFQPSEMVETLIERTRERLARDERLLRRLTRVHAASPDAWSDVLRTIGLLRGLGAEDASARQRLALAHGGDAQQDVLPLVDAALQERDPNSAGAMDWALARMGDDAVPPLAEALQAQDAEQRRRAVLALQKIGSRRALAALARGFGHPDPFVSGRAALVRARNGQAQVIPALIDLIVEGRDDVEAAEVLGALADRRRREEQVVGAIADRLTSSDESARARLTAA